MPLTDTPMAFTAAMITIAIPAAMMEYSIAVVPRVSRAKLTANRVAWE